MSVKLLKSTSTVALMTLLSRVLGLFRDIVFAQVFGAGAAFDAFVIAFKIPNFFRRLFAEGAFSQAFVPVLSEYRANRSHEETLQLISRVGGSLSLAVMALVILVELLVPVVVLIFAPGFHDDPVRLHLARTMLHITFPYLWLITLTAFSGAILNTYHRFTIPAFTPVLLNLALIGVAYGWARHAQVPIVALSTGVLVGGCLQLLIQVPALMRLKCWVWPSIQWRDPGVRRILRMMVPALFGVSVAQIGLIVDNFFASFLPKGSISWLYYSDRLTYLPLGVIGVALSTVVMPHLAYHHAKDDNDGYGHTLNWALKIAVFIGLPAALGLGLLAGPILATLIHHGAFGDYDVRMASLSLRAFSVGLVAFMLIKILASAFYAKHNIRTPVKIAAVALLINVIFNFILIKPLAHAGLALATSIAAWVNALGLLFFLLRARHFKADRGWVKFVLGIVFAGALMSVFLLFFQSSLSLWLNWSTGHAIVRLLGLIVGGVVIYVAALWLMGYRWKTFSPPSDAP